MGERGCARSSSRPAKFRKGQGDGRLCLAVVSPRSWVLTPTGENRPEHSQGLDQDMEDGLFLAPGSAKSKGAYCCSLKYTGT